ncbi:hypothetical protein [Lichenicola sp.]
MQRRLLDRPLADLDGKVRGTWHFVKPGANPNPDPSRLSLW